MGFKVAPRHRGRGGQARVWVRDLLVGGFWNGRGCHESPGPLVGSQQGVHFPPKVQVASTTFPHQPFTSLPSGHFHRLGKDPLCSGGVVHTVPVSRPTGMGDPAEPSPTGRSPANASCRPVRARIGTSGGTTRWPRIDDSSWCLRVGNYRPRTSRNPLKAFARYGSKGGRPARLAQRGSIAPWLQHPPRTTRPSPHDGPRGSVSGELQ